MESFAKDSDERSTEPAEPSADSQNDNFALGQTEFDTVSTSDVNSIAKETTDENQVTSVFTVSTESSSSEQVTDVQFSSFSTDSTEEGTASYESSQPAVIADEIEASSSSFETEDTTLIESTSVTEEYSVTELNSSDSSDLSSVTLIEEVESTTGESISTQFSGFHYAETSEPLSTDMAFTDDSAEQTVTPSETETHTSLQSMETPEEQNNSAEQKITQSTRKDSTDAADGPSGNSSGMEQFLEEETTVILDNEQFTIIPEEDDGEETTPGFLNATEDQQFLFSSFQISTETATEIDLLVPDTSANYDAASGDMAITFSGDSAVEEGSFTTASFSGDLSSMEYSSIDINSTEAESTTDSETVSSSSLFSEVVWESGTLGSTGPVTYQPPQQESIPNEDDFEFRLIMKTHPPFTYREHSKVNLISSKVISATSSSSSLSEDSFSSVHSPSTPSFHSSIPYTKTFRTTVPLSTSGHYLHSTESPSSVPNSGILHSNLYFI